MTEDTEILCPILISEIDMENGQVRNCHCIGAHCAWYIDGKCAVVIIAEKIQDQSDKIMRLSKMIPTQLPKTPKP